LFAALPDSPFAFNNILWRFSKIKYYLYEKQPLELGIGTPVWKNWRVVCERLATLVLKSLCTLTNGPYLKYLSTAQVFISIGKAIMIQLPTAVNLLRFSGNS